MKGPAAVCPNIWDCPVAQKKTRASTINPKYWGTVVQMEKFTDISPFGKQHDLPVSRAMLT
jgi:hypothetical protein